MPPVVVWSELCLIDSTCILTCSIYAWSIWPAYHASDLLLCDVMYIQWWYRYSIYLTLIWLIPPVVVWSTLCLVDSTCIWLIPPFYDLYSRHITHSTGCCVMWCIFSDCIGIPSIWPWYDRFHLLWYDPSCVWSTQLIFDWFHLFMIYSACIARNWPCIVLCDL